MAKSDVSVREAAVRERIITRGPDDERVLMLKRLAEAVNRVLDCTEDVELHIDSRGRLAILQRIVVVRELWTRA